MSCVAIIPCLSDVGTKVRNFYKETGKLSKRLFELRRSFLTTFTRARIHNMWQECKNVAKIFQREGGGSHFVKQTHQCDKKMCGVMGTPGCCSEKQSGKLRKFKAHSHLPPHCPPTWKYTNHFSLTTSGLN